MHTYSYIECHVTSGSIISVGCLKHLLHIQTLHYVAGVKFGIMNNDCCFHRSMRTTIRVQNRTMKQKQLNYHHLMQVGLSDVCVCVCVQRSVVQYAQLRVEQSVNLSTYNFTTCLADISLSLSPTHCVSVCVCIVPPPLAPLLPSGCVVDFHYFYYKCSPVLLLLLHNHTQYIHFRADWNVLVSALMYCITLCRALRKIRPPTDVEHLH